MRLVTAISLEGMALVTTSFAHDYLPGLIVRIVLDDLYGMAQINQRVGTILTVPTNSTFTLDIDTQEFDAFVVPDPQPWYLNVNAQVIPVGEINSQIAQATRNVS